MGSASDYWTSFRDLDRDSDHCRNIEKVLRTADFDFLCTTAVSIRQSSNAESEHPSTEVRPLTCPVDRTKFASGQYHVVLELRFSDSRQWVARIRLPSTTAVDDAEITYSLLSEVATMRLVYSRTSIPIPQVYGYNVDGTNSFGFRFLLLEALPGRVLSTTFARSVPQSHWDKVSSQLADYYHQLSQLRFDHIGRLAWEPNGVEDPKIVPCRGSKRFSTSLEYFYTHRQDQTQEIRAQHGSDEQWATAAWILEQALPSMVINGFIYGPFPLCHVDLHFNNILIDEEFNITGIIDWSEAQTVPLELFLASPEFMTFPGLSAERNTPIVTFRDKFAKTLKTKEMAVRDMSEGSDISAQPFLADLIGSSRLHIVYRCMADSPGRALPYARLVLNQIYGGDAKWEDFVNFFNSSPLHSKC